MGSSSSENGRLEIFLQGEWGTVCNDGFDSIDADVACRRLGYYFANDFGNAFDLG